MESNQPGSAADSAHVATSSLGQFLVQDRRGFALILFVGLLPVFIAAFSLVFVSHQLIRQFSRTRNECRRGLIQAQEQAAGPMKALLDLNEKAMTLKAQAALARQRWLMALASENPLAIAAAQAEIVRIESLRRKLDLQQRLLFESAAKLLREGQERTYQTLFSISNEVARSSISRPRIIRPALVPVGSGPAPVWRMQEPFRERQTTEQAWQLRLSWKGPGSRFLTASGQFDQSCAVTLNPKGISWIAQLNEIPSEAKPLSKVF